MNKKVIWLTGSMSSGKSTQRRNLCNEFATLPAEVFEGEEKGLNYHFTSFGVISCLGKVRQEENGEISMCDGLDSVFGHLKKDGSIYTVHKALQKSKVVVIEGSQTSPSWGELLQPILTRHKADLYLVHLSLSYWDNFNRLRERHWHKLTAKGVLNQEGDLNLCDITLTDKNIESLIGKSRQFNNCYEKLKGLCPRLKIDATQSEQRVFKQIVKFVFADVLS